MSRAPMPDDTDRRHRNRLLAALPAEELRRLEPALDEVSLALKEVIYEANDPIKYVYFPSSGVVSFVITMHDGATVEVGTVGNEGMVGLPVFLGSDKSPTRALSQIPGTAFRMPAAVFKNIVDSTGPVQHMIRQYSQAMVNQISQSVACNHLHSIEERMCRWLLMCHDRVGADEFLLSQEFLSQMLAVRRPSVTIVAGMLQNAGLIAYRRGRITVVDRRRLEEAACECYRVVKDEYDRLLGPPQVAP